MEIRIKSTYGSTYVLVDAENVKIEDCISESEYALKEDGKKDFSKRLGDDITDSDMQIFCSLLDDIVYYRRKPFDTSSLIQSLFDKLPEEKKSGVLKYIESAYDPEE